MRFVDQVVIVTGGAQGIGRACVDAFAGEGAAVVVADVDAEGGRKAAAAIEAQGGRASFIATDVGDAAQAQRLVDQTLQTFGRLDVLINNAGIIKTAEFLEISEADFDAVLRVNLKGVFLVGQAAARAMVTQGKGAIVNMSSANAVVAIPNQVPYVTSKGAVNQLTKVMALALADKGVRVNAIGPGYILTPLLTNTLSQEALNGLSALHPIGRLGKPEEVAELVLWLSSPKSSFVTGSYYTIDGAYTDLERPCHRPRRATLVGACEACVRRQPVHADAVCGRHRGGHVLEAFAALVAVRRRADGARANARVALDRAERYVARRRRRNHRR